MKKHLSPQSYPTSANFKGFLFVLAVAITLGLLLYTNWLVDQLREDARKLVNLYRKSIVRVITDESIEEFSFIFENVIKDINFPIAQTDPEGEPVGWRNLQVESDDRSPEAIETVSKLVSIMDNENEPIPIEYQSQILGFIHYGDSKLIRHLKWLPYLEILVVALYIFIGYFGFSNVKKSEQRSIWVGMAKETAHQLGTPISSLMGWMEILQAKTKSGVTEKLIVEMGKDIERLNKIASRFSKIGSKAEITDCNVSILIKNIVEYFRLRLPQMGKEIEIIENYEREIICKLNFDLFEWAIENLIKNALDAIDRPTGKIELSLFRQNGNVVIDIKDNGKGIELKKRKDISKVYIC